MWCEIRSQARKILINTLLYDKKILVLVPPAGLEPAHPVKGRGV